MKRKPFPVLYDNYHTEARRKLRIGLVCFLFAMLGAGLFVAALWLGGAI